jgi:uncharacterized protein (TIGR02594 family)
MPLPAAYAWLSREPAPRILVEALKHYGVAETKGPKHNPVVLAWAKRLAPDVAAWFNNDEYPWCALFLSAVCSDLGLPVPAGWNAVRAMGFLTWGDAAQTPMLGDVLVFRREGGGHVGLYVGEDDEAYHVLGGNQGDRVSIARLSKLRCVAARRTPWARRQPPTVRRIVLGRTGELSENER